MKTINSLLFFNIRDYAHLVFDFSDYAQQAKESGGFKIEMRKLKLLATEIEIPQKPQDKVTEVVKESVINVLEGWGTKYKSANTGFGIVIAILIVAIIACFFVFRLNSRKMHAQR